MTESNQLTHPKSDYIVSLADGMEIVIDTKTNEAYASVSGAARMLGVSRPTVDAGCKSGGSKMAQIPTQSGLQSVMLISLGSLEPLALEQYNKQPTQNRFNALKALYYFQNKPTEGLVSLHNLNKGNKAKLTGTARERQIQLGYQARYGGEIEVPTTYGRADLVTEDTIYEFKVFKGYKEAMGQLLAYGQCLPQAKLIMVLFGTPKRFKNYNLGLPGEIKKLCRGYGITVKFLR